VKIIDLETMGSKLSYSQRSIVLSVNEQKREFVIIDYRPDKFILKTIDYEGRQIDRKEIARFNDTDYWDTICALSPDRRYLAYLGYDKYLYLLDFETGEKTKLIKDQLVSDEMFMRGIRWLSDSEFIIIKQKSTMSLYSPIDDSSLTRFNVKTKSVVKKIELTRPEKYKISPLKNYLLVLDSDRISPDFKLFDMKTLELLESRKNSGFEYIDDVCWSPSEEYLAYVKNDSIVIRPRDSAKEREVKVLPKRALCYHLEFLNENTLIFTYGTKTNPDDENTLRAIDLTTGKESILLKGEFFRGRIYVIDNGRKLIAEVGD
jgi:WD40 repeat protein